jgi:hypothetical protein
MCMALIVIIIKREGSILQEFPSPDRGARHLGPA